MVHMNVMPRANERGFERIRTAIARVIPVRRNVHTVGIEIASDAVRMCHVHRRKGVPKIVQFTSSPLPLEAIVDEAIMNSEPIVAALRACHAMLTANGMPKDARAVIGVGGHSVIIKRIVLPQMTDEELAESMPWEAEQYMPYDINDVFMDTAALERLDHGEMAALLVAVKKDIVRERVELIETAMGVVPTAVDMNVLALERAYSAYRTAPLPGETIVLVNIGDAMMHLHILTNGQFAFTRDISMGSEYFVQRVQQQLNVSWDAAGALVREHGITPAPVQGTGTDAVASGVRTILTGVADTIAGELQRSLDFYQAATVDNALSRLYLSGTAAAIVQLQRAIEQRSGIPVEVETFLGQLDGVPMRLASAPVAAWAIPVGLALHDGRRSPDHSTLVPVPQLGPTGGHTIPEMHGPNPFVAPKYRPSKQEFARCLEALALLLATGVPVLDALTIVQQDGGIGKNMRRCLKSIHDRVAEGADIGRVFDAVVDAPVVTHALIAGELTGRLVETLRACAQYLTTGTTALLPIAPGNPPHLHAVGDDE